MDRLFDVGPVSMAAYPTAKIESVGADEILSEALSTGLIRAVSFGHDQQAERLDSMLKSLKAQLRDERLHGEFRRALETRAAELARYRKKIA